LPFRYRHPTVNIENPQVVHKAQANFYLKDVFKVKNFINLLKNLDMNLCCKINLKLPDRSDVSVKLTITEGELNKVELGSYKPLINPKIHPVKFSLYKSNSDIDVLMNPNSRFNSDSVVYMNNFNSQNINSNPASMYIPTIIRNILPTIDFSPIDLNLQQITDHEAFVRNMEILSANIQDGSFKGIQAGVNYFHVLRDFIESIKPGCDYDTYNRLTNLGEHVKKGLRLIHGRSTDTLGQIMVSSYDMQELVSGVHKTLLTIISPGLWDSSNLLDRNSPDVAYTTLYGEFEDLDKLNRDIISDKNMMQRLIDVNLGNRLILLDSRDVLAQ